MPDLTKKAESMASKKSGLIAPADEPQVRGPRPVLNNAWGSALAGKQRSPNIKGK